MMGPSAEPSLSPVGNDRPFDDYAFINLAATGQIDNLSSLLEVEKRKYCFSTADCNQYRLELNGAAGLEGSSSNNVDWRYRIIRWMLRASDEFSVSRETALIAMSYCDRFLLMKKISRHLFQIVAISCLFTASKLFEKRPIKMASLMNYTQCKFDRDEVISIEGELLTAIGSFMYPPTAGTFVLIFLNEFSCMQFMSALIDTTQFMIELASCSKRPSLCLDSISCMLTMNSSHFITCRLLFCCAQAIHIGCSGHNSDNGANALESTTRTDSFFG